MLVDIVLIADASGSMHSIKEEADGALNAFIEDQRKLEGDAFVSLVCFDHRIQKMFEALPLEEVPKINIKPGGSTALLDAIGSTVVDYVPEGEKTIYVIMTDGEENASQEWSYQAVKNLIKESTDQGDEFVFLGANQDAITVGGSLGISKGSSMTFAPDAKGLEAVSTSMTSYVAATRSGLKYEFSDEERGNATGLTNE